MSSTWTFADVVSQIALLNTSPGILAVLTAAIATLPTTLPASAGVLWNNGGSLQIS